MMPEPVPAFHNMIQDLLRIQNQQMDQLNALDDRVNPNSRNSSKPPLSDGPGPPPAQKAHQERQTCRRPDRQQGQAWEILTWDQMNHRVECTPPSQCEGYCAQIKVDSDKGIQHQAFDPPCINPLVTEYILLRCIFSGCGRKNNGALPQKAIAISNFRNHKQQELLHN